MFPHALLRGLRGQQRQFVTKRFRDQLSHSCLRCLSSNCLYVLHHNCNSIRICVFLDRLWL